jgi:hypothetical protein
MIKFSVYTTDSLERRKHWRGGKIRVLEPNAKDFFNSPKERQYCIA